MIEHLLSLSPQVSEAVLGKEVILNEAHSKLLGKESVEGISLEEIDSMSPGELKERMHEAIESELKEMRTQQIERNRLDGASREQLAHTELQKYYPEIEGYKVHQELYLRDSNGQIVKDDVSGEARRIDFMIEKDHEIMKSYEVTSELAPKDQQTLKENRIRELGGNYIKDREFGNLIYFPTNIKTEIIRYK